MIVRQFGRGVNKEKTLQTGQKDNQTSQQSLDKIYKIA